MSGSLEGIWIKRAHHQPMDSVESARAVERRGLEDNINQNGKRQVTLLSAEAWQAASQEIGRELDPVVRRANLLVTGLDLEQSQGRVILVGSVPILIHGETKPCQRMERACSGLRARLAVGWRGGAYGEILADGEITVGDPVQWDD